MGWKNLEAAFYGCSNLTTFKGGDVSQVTDMRHMFSGASSLEQLDTSNWDVSSVENMALMFIFASKLEQLDLSNWDFGSVASMRNMFVDASGLTTESYSDMLMRIVDTSIKDSIPLGGGLAKYNDCGAKARAILITAPRNWDITDGGAQDGGVDIDRCTKWSPSPP